MARFLLEKHPDTVNSTTTEENGRWTPLHAAAAKAAVSTALSYYCNMERTSKQRRVTAGTPLHIAAANGQLLAVKCLLREGSSRNSD